MKRLTKISLIGASALVIITSIFGCNHFHSPENRAQWAVDKISSKLDLTEAQQFKLEALSDEMLATRKSMKLKFADSREQMMVIFDQPTLDQEKVLNIIKSHTQMVDEKAPAVVLAFADFYDNLNTAQQAEVREFMHKRKDHHGYYGSHGYFRDH